MPAPLTFAILAGGGGTRLGGRDKGLLDVAGRPLVAWACDLAPAGADVLIVANRHAEDYARFGRVVADRWPGQRGPLAGIATALAESRSAWVMTVPVDCPRPPADLVPRLRAALDAAPGAELASACEARGPQPLFALYRRSLAERAALALQRDLPVWRWQDEEGAVRVDFSDAAAAFANLNAEADRASLLERLAHG